MIPKTTILLISMIWCVQSEDLLDRRNVPVRLFDLDNVIIEGHHGPLDANILELLKNVETLAFYNCNFTVSNENNLNPLKDLQKLTYSNCHFGGFKEDKAECCEKLREVEMIESSVGPWAAADFKNTVFIKSLERLHLNRMEIPTLSANALIGSNLKNLEIVSSGLTTIEDGSLNGMNKLEVLELQNNKLKNVPTASLAVVKTLKELNLKNNLLEKITAADIPPLPNLEKLNLGHNPIKEIDLNGLKEKLPKIKEIDCSGIDIDPSKAEGLPIIKVQIG